MKPPYSILILLACCSLLSLRCGGEKKSTSPPDIGPAASRIAGAGATAPDSSRPSANSATNTPSVLAKDSGIVTVGDKSWVFDVSSFCNAQPAASEGTEDNESPGSFGAAGKAADGQDIYVDLSLPPSDWQTRKDFDDWDPPALRVGDKVNGHDWVAGGPLLDSVVGVTPDMSLVTAFSVDGQKASGTAVFVDYDAIIRGEAPVPLGGSFQFYCDDDSRP